MTYRLRGSSAVNDGIFILNCIVGDVSFSLSRHSCEASVVNWLVKVLVKCVN